MSDQVDRVRSAFVDTPVSLTDEESITYANASMPPGLTLMNAVCVHASRDRGEVGIRFELDENFVNVVGIVCGGYVAQMLDQAATFAATLVTGDAAPSLTLSASFLSAARPGRFEATGRVVGRGRSVAFLEADLVDQTGRVVAKGTVTSQLISRSSFADRGSKPPRDR